MTVAWPGGVPSSCNITSLQEVDQDTLLRWTPEFGVDKLRRRTSTYVQTIKYQKIMTLAQWDALMLFYRTTLQNGALPFTTLHPRTGDTITAQFTKIPAIKSLESSKVVTVAIEFSILPAIPASPVPPWVPIIGTTKASFFADYSANNYWYNNQIYGDFPSFHSALGVTFTRSSGAYYTNNLGVLVQAGSGVLRQDYDPILLTLKGILLEQGSTNLALRSGDITNASNWTPNHTTVASGIVGPDGASTATHIMEDSANAAHYTNNAVGTFGAGTYTWSVYLKAAERTQAYISDGSGNFGLFDLANGVVLGGPSTMTPAGNGWYRCTMTVTIGSSTFLGFLVAPTVGGGSGTSYVGTTGWGIYAQFAQLEIFSFATSYIPTTTATASRAADSLTASSIGAWYNATNSVLYAAADIGLNAPTIQAGGALLGIDDNSLNNRVQLLAQAFATTTQYLAFAESGGVQQLQILSNDTGQAQYLPNALRRTALSAAASNFVFVGDAGPADSQASGSMPVSPSRLLIGGGQYQHIAQIGYWPTTANAAQLQALTTAPPAPPWVPIIGTVAPAFFCDFSAPGPGGTQGLYYLRGVQFSSFNAWLAAILGTFTRSSTAYYTNSSGILTQALSGQIRFDWDPISLQSRGLLLEGGSTNITPQSNNFSNAVWTATNAAVASGATTSPDGTNDGWSFTGSGGSATHTLNLGTGVTTPTAASTNCTASVYVKDSTMNYVSLSFTSTGDGAGWVAAVFDLTKGAVSQTSQGANGTFVSASIANVGNGWYRVSVTGSIGSNTNGTMLIQGAGAATGNSFGGFGVLTYTDTGNVFYLFGAQLEQLGSATSYIPTTTTAVTRPTDVLSSTPVASWFNANTGTMLATCDFPPGIGGQTFMYIGDGTDNNRVQLYYDGSHLEAFASSGGSPVFGIGTTVPQSNVFFKLAVSYSTGGNQSLVANDGTAAGSGTYASAIVGATTLSIGENISDFHPVYGHVGQVGFWPTTATSGQLQALTAPPAWVPTAVGVLPSIFADFAGGNYMVNGYAQPSLAVWESQVNWVSPRSSTAYYTGSDGLLHQAANNVLRFDYDPVLLTPRGLLLEGTSTNIARSSQDFSGTGSWGGSNTTLVANAATAPDGTVTAGQVTENSANSTHYALTSASANLTSGQTYTYSLYAKYVAGSHNLQLLDLGGSTGGFASFDLQAGTVTGSGGSGFVRAYIQKLINGWYRIAMTLTATGTGTADPSICFTNAPGTAFPTFVGDGISSYYIWGMQTENNPFASSYIPTLSSTVTRAADLPKFAWPNTTTTLFAQVNAVPIGAITAAQRIFGNTSNVDAPLFIADNTHVNTYNQSIGGIAPAASLGSDSFGGKAAVAVAGSPSGRTDCGNQGTVQSDANALYSLAPATFIWLGSDGSGNAQNEVCGNISRFGAWPIVATSTQLQNLTVPV